MYILLSLFVFVYTSVTVTVTVSAFVFNANSLLTVMNSCLILSHHLTLLNE